MSIKLNAGNTHPIHLVQHEIALTAPVGATVRWSYPGYISIVLSDNTEIAFGEDQERDGGYGWNDYAPDGTNRYLGSFDDLKDIKAIVAKLWEQTAHLIENKGE
jgi:hypothetical protein